VTHPIVEQDGLRIPLRFDPRFPGWAYGALLDSSAHPPTTRRLRFLALDSKLDTLRWDSAGTPWTVKIDSGDSVWRMPEGPSPNQHPDPLQPTIWFGYPSDTRLALRAGLEGFAGKQIAVGWSGLPLWVRPDTVWLIHSTGTVSRGIHVPSTGDSVWLAADTVSAGRQASPLDTVWLKARAFDYDHSYKPFAESGPDDACPESGGGPTKGLVKSSLDSAGLPVWTGRVACDIGTSADGPGNWFKPGHALLDTTVSIPLALSRGLGVWSYSNQAFFPLDHASTAPKGGNNFGFCLHFQFEASNFPDAEVSIVGDDDIWLFAQNLLALDLGGQHGPASGKFAFARIGEPEGRVIRMDLFQCERHITGSTLAISSNALLLPAGTLVDASYPTTKIVSNGVRQGVFQLVGRRLTIQPSSEAEWSMEVRRLDGRAMVRRSGRGAASVELAVRGPVAVEWRANGIRETRMFVLP
jgi:fibro-slime domain-containing protein